MAVTRRKNHSEYGVSTKYVILVESIGGKKRKGKYIPHSAKSYRAYLVGDNFFAHGKTAQQAFDILSARLGSFSYNLKEAKKAFKKI